MPVEIIDVQQNTPEWFQARCGLPTASNFQCLMAESADRKGRATYLRQVAGEILTGIPSESFKNAAMDRGHAMEPEAREMYAFMHDCEPVQVGFVRNGRKGWSPDSLIGSSGCLEIKTQAPHLLIETIEKDVFPGVHKAQTQGGLLVGDLEWIDLVVFYTGMPLFEKRAVRDVAYIAKLSREIDLFNEEVDELVEKIRRYGAAPSREPLMSQLRTSVEA
jgi:hypothetical protein